MRGVTRKGFSSALANAAIDLQDEDLGAALADASLDMGRLDALDGKTDGRITGQQAIDDLYDEINRLDTHTATLGSKQERAVWTALRGAAVGPAEISAEQGLALAAAARQQVAEDKPAKGTLSPWALAGQAICENPALSKPKYAGKDAWKCNVFVGEAFHKSGLPFPINGESHYAAASRLPGASAFFRTLDNLDEVRLGDLVSIKRNGEASHIEIVTAVNRGTDGRIVSIISAGAHRSGSTEGSATAAPLVKASSATVQRGIETYRILRPLAPPTGG